VIEGHTTHKGKNNHINTVWDNPKTLNTRYELNTEGDAIALRILGK